MGIFANEPGDGWHAGDRAYCINGTTRCTPTLEAGKVYRVADVMPISNMAHDGLTIVGVAPLAGTVGFWSNRFVKLDRPTGALRQIAEGTRRKMWSR